MIIANKTQMYDLYQGGALGNRIRSWNSLKELLESGFTGQVGIRYRGTVPGGPARYNLRLNELGPVIEQLVSEGWDPARLVFSEATPDPDLVFQGEVIQTINHVDLYFSTLKTRMRDALAQGGQWESGRPALARMRRHMSPASYEDIQELLDTYRDAAIEFSCYRRNIGTCRGRNTIIWEVRNY